MFRFKPATQFVELYHSVVNWTWRISFRTAFVNSVSNKKFLTYFNVHLTNHWLIFWPFCTDIGQMMLTCRLQGVSGCARYENRAGNSLCSEMGRSWMGDVRNTYKILIVKCEGNRPLGRPRHRWKDNIKIYSKEVEYAAVHWIHLVQNKNQ
jgi:hypothetical protein